MADRYQNGLSPQLVKELRKAGIEPLGLGEDAAEPKEWNPIGAAAIVSAFLIGFLLVGWGLSLLVREGFIALYDGVQSFTQSRSGP